MPAFINLKNIRFGRLTVLKRVENTKQKKIKWLCKCDCGNETISTRNDLRSGDKKSCGCLRKDLLRVDIEGKKFGKLTALEITKGRGSSTAEFWLCKCDCGNEHSVSSQHLRLKQVLSCGCIKKINCEKYKHEFLKNIEKTESCWNWKGRLARGYGILFADKYIKAHRFSFIFYNGEIPKGKIICHTCDNPKCVNPDHLYAGTYTDNAKDREKRTNAKKHKVLKER